MSFNIVIPARYGSTRLPGKPLLDIAGKPMVQRVWEQARRSGAAEVIIATDDQRIADAAGAFGASVCMTRADHPSGTDRLQEVATRCGWGDEQIVVNVQGDEPLIPPAVIDQVAANLSAKAGAGMATLCEPIGEVRELLDPNAVKVVFDARGMALYFSRATIPWPRDAFRSQPGAMPGQGSWYRHIGIYAYRTAFLHRYVTWEPAPLEQLEQLEQLRALYNGTGIHVARACCTVPGGVDTQSDLDTVRASFAAEQAPLSAAGPPTRVLFVCLGNICRSPTAHGVFAALVERDGLAGSIEVDSCGTGGWHVGEPPDRRATLEAGARGYDLRSLRARQLRADDFRRFDYMLAMDENNLADMRTLCPGDFSGHLGLFLDFAPQRGEREVPDPYYGGDEGFAHVLDLVEAASEGLLREIRRARAD